MFFVINGAGLKTLADRVVISQSSMSEPNLDFT